MTPPAPDTLWLSSITIIKVGDDGTVEKQVFYPGNMRHPIEQIQANDVEYRRVRADDEPEVHRVENAGPRDRPDGPD